MGSFRGDILRDERQLAQFVHDLNVARRFIAAYPPEHPLLVAAEQKVAALAAHLLATNGPLTFGVGKDRLHIATEPLNLQNPDYVAFAQILYSHAVAAISIVPGVTPDELHLLNDILGQKPEQVRQNGGISAVTAGRLSHIRLREIDYDAFRATDDAIDPLQVVPPGGLWQAFVISLLTGSVNLEQEKWQGVDLDDVNTLTQIVLEQGNTDTVRRMIANFCQALTRLNQDLRGGRDADEMAEMFSRIAQFIDGLSPELRQQFLESTLATLADDPDVTCKLLEKMTPSLVLDTLQELSLQGMKLPPLVLGLVNLLARNADLELPAGLLHEQEAGSRLRELFREDDLDQFVPAAYRQALQRVLTDMAPPGGVGAQPVEMVELLATTSSHVLEAKTSDIILQILRTCPDEAMIAALQGNLLEMVGYFLEVGDFARLIDLHHRLTGEGADGPVLAMVRDNVLQVYASDAFIREVFHGLGFWGKAKFQDIQQLITTVGEPFVEPLLERLAEEQNMSLRRFYMDRLLDNGPAIRDCLLAKLRDGRWYFVRNLLVLLRAINDPQVCKSIRRLTAHPHPRVRHEAIRTLLHYGDAEADKTLLQQLDSSDEETLYTALQLAEKSTGSQVFGRLLRFMDRGSLTNYEYKLKSTVVATLGEIGNPDALPRLEQILLSGSLLHAGSHARLKADIMRTLDRYPAAQVVPLLRRLIEKGNNEQVRLAGEMFRQIQRKVHGSAGEKDTP